MSAPHRTIIDNRLLTLSTQTVEITTTKSLLSDFIEATLMNGASGTNKPAHRQNWKISKTLEEKIPM